MKSKQMQTNNLIVFETISLLGPKTLNLILKANIKTFNVEISRVNLSNTRIHCSSAGGEPDRRRAWRAASNRPAKARASSAGPLGCSCGSARA